MVFLGLQKLQDVERFATMFRNYDLLAQRWVRYGYVYRFVETGAGLLMMAGVLTWLSAPAALGMRKHWCDQCVQGRLHRQV